MRIVAVDPGKTTGFVFGEHVRGHFDLEWSAEYPMTSLYALTSQIIKFLWNKQDQDWRGTLIIENFKIYPGRGTTGAGAGDGLSPVFVTGYILGALETRRPKAFEKLNVVYQMASDAKGVMTDKRLKESGLWIVGKQHARDAARHAELFCRKLGSSERS